MQQRKTVEPDDITRYLHATKGWRYGEPPADCRALVAIQMGDGSYLREVKRPARKVVTGGMFRITKKVQ